jgi:hypothetical protein
MMRGRRTDELLDGRTNKQTGQDQKRVVWMMMMMMMRGGDKKERGG